MSIPGFAPTGAQWTSPVPGWTSPARDTPTVEISEAVTVDLDGIHMVSRHGRGEVVVTTLDGWWDGVERISASTDVPGHDGLLEGEQWLGARPLQVEGYVEAATPGALFELVERLGSPLSTPGNRYGDLVVSESARGLSRQCRVSVVTARARPIGRVSGKFTWTLRAADPVRYARDAQQVRLTPGGADQGIENRGNTPVPLTLRLRGPLVKPILWIDGAQWRLTRDVAAGETVIAYWKDREVWSGMNSLRFWQSGPWTHARPGMTQVGLSTAAASTGDALVSWRSGWL